MSGRNRRDVILEQSATSKKFEEQVKAGIYLHYKDFNTYDYMMAFASLENREVLIIDYLQHQDTKSAFFSTMSEFCVSVTGTNHAHTAIRETLWRLDGLALVGVELYSNGFTVALSPEWEKALMSEYYFGFNRLGDKTWLDRHIDRCEQSYKLMTSRKRKFNKKKEINNHEQHD